jgi:hypothetical protein
MEAVVKLLGLVLIRCDDPSHARGKVAEVETFARYDLGDGDAPVWTKMGNQGRSTVRLHGNSLAPEMSGEAIERERAEGMARVSFDLECKLCGLKVDATQDGLMVRVLDTLAANGVSSITLNGLAARFSGKQ